MPPLLQLCSYRSMDCQWLTDSLDDTFVSFLKKTPDALKSYEDTVQGLLKVDLNSVTGEDINAELVTQLEKFEAEKTALTLVLGQVKMHIALKEPEIKEEDNAGVRVQEIAIGYINRATAGGARGSKEDNSSDAAINGVASKGDYYASRAKLEKEKAGEKVSEKEIALCNLQLKELDRQTYQKLILAWRNMSFHRASVYSVLKLNRDKVENPRRREYGMAL